LITTTVENPDSLAMLINNVTTEPVYVNQDSTPAQILVSIILLILITVENVETSAQLIKHVSMEIAPVKIL
jgi:hypothetical protein